MEARQSMTGSSALSGPSSRGIPLRAWLEGLDARSDLASLTVWLLPMTLLVMLPVSWFPNEENYFLLAYRRVTPEELWTYSAAFDRSNARLFFDTVTGAAVAVLGFEVAQTVFRLVMAALYAFAFAMLFSGMGLTVLRALAAIVLFDFAGETIFGDDWLFRGVESKTFAYATVMIAFGLGLRSRWVVATTLVVLATHIHFLVGGFWALALFVLAALRHVPLRHVVGLLCLYLLLVAPLIAVIAIEQIGASASVTGGGPDANTIYALRNPHHIAPFSSGWVVWTWARGVVGAMLLFGLLLMIANSAADRSLPRLALVLLGCLFAASIVAYLDRHTHVLAKFYMFRPTTLTLLLSLAIIVSEFDRWVPDRLKPRLTTVLAALIGLGFVVQGALKVRESLAHAPFPDRADLIKAVDGASAPGEIVLVQPKNEKAQPHVGLVRALPRPTLVSYKFVPTNREEILRWRDLMEYREALFAGGCRDRLAYPIRLILVFDAATLERVSSCGSIVWRGGESMLIRVDDTFAHVSTSEPEGNVLSDAEVRPDSVLVLRRDQRRTVRP